MTKPNYWDEHNWAYRKIRREGKLICTRADGDARLRQPQGAQP